jgi:hypothetical protein
MIGKALVRQMARSSFTVAVVTMGDSRTTGVRRGDVRGRGAAQAPFPVLSRKAVAAVADDGEVPRPAVPAVKPDGR